MSANPSSGSRPSPRQAVVDLLATWGAPADPAVAPLFAALPRRFSLTDLLALVRDRSRDILPAALRDEMDRASAVLQAGGSAEAPSFRARLAGLLEQAGEALELSLLTERSELATLLAERWEELGDGPIADTLAALWASTEESTIAGRVAGIEQIRAATSALRAAPAGTGRAPAGRPGGTAGPGPVSAPGGAADKRYAVIVEAVKRAAEATRTSGADGAGASRLLTALGRIEPGLTSDAAETTALLDLFENEILPDQAEQADRARRQAEGRIALVATLAAMAKDVATQVDVASITDRTREQAAAGGPDYYEAVRTAAERLVALRLKSAAALEASAATLRNASRDLESILPKLAPHLPTPQVVESRLLLEQAAGVLQAGRREEIDAHAEAVRRRLEEVRQISEARQASSKERGQKNRQSIVAAIGALRAVAPPGAARRLTRIEAGLTAGGKGSSPDAARGEIDRLARDVEQQIRLAAARRLTAARSLLHKRGGATDACDAAARSASAAPGPASPAPGLAAACDSLAGALAGDDLAAIRDRSDALGTLLQRASPWQRPAVRGAAAGAAALLIVGLVAGASLFRNRAQTVRLELPPGSWETVWMVRDGHLVEERRGGGTAAPEFRLAPGTYEIYLDRKYTGRRFTVPGETVVKDVVPTPSPASAGSTGAGNEPTADR